MLVVNKELLETDNIITIYTKKWETDSSLITNCSLNEIKSVIQEVIKKDKRCVLIV